MSGARPEFNASAADGKQALVAAIEAGDVAGATALLKQGARLDAGAYKTHVLEQRSKIGFIRPFIEFGGMDINATDNYGSTALQIASICKDNDLARWLIKGGINIDSRDRNNATALWNAAQNGRIEIMKMLLEAGANLYLEYSPTHRVEIRGSNGNNQDVVNGMLRDEAKRRAREIADREAAVADQKAALARAAKYNELKRRAPRRKPV